MLLQATTGRETFPSGSCQYQLLIMPTRTHRLPQETFISTVARAANQAIPIQTISFQKHAAQAGSMVDMGTWYQNTYDVPDGIVIKVFGQRSMTANAYGARGGLFKDIGALIIKTRADAALRRIRCRTTGDGRATFTDVFIEGRFDILSLREAVQAGVQINMKTTKQLTNRQSLDNLFTIETLDQEITAPKVATTTTVKTDTGKTVEVVTPKRRRALDID